ncbi:hypothetical protein L7F22_025860 [Adiantum nelumboides]|nr:hypothetical protein [Adiantum nelumboides]
MPRPGLRPYECIRRAWHSDGHQPLRGTLIHEIFRLVNDLHSTSTRRKKEWQEKLPVVVLRAEEILYSKANSEGEYADVETLRSRLDDAVNTMIRREDGEEEGLYLVPCVEAALSLGCVPKKTPRSQRQSSSRHVLNVARRVAPAVRPAGKEDCTVGSVCMDNLCSLQAKHTCSTFGLMTQTMPMQGQDPQSTLNASSSFFGPIGAFWGPNSCHGCDMTSKILPKSTCFPEALDLHHPMLYPEQGALVQFLRETSASRFLNDLPLDVTLFSTPQKHFNVQELGPRELVNSAERLKARTGSRFLDGYALACPSDIQPLGINGRLSWDGYADNLQKTGDLGARSTLHDSMMSLSTKNDISCEGGSDLQVKECPLASVNGLTGSVPKADLCFTTTRCKGDKAPNNTAATLSANHNSRASYLGDHDLQLRLGPPIREPTSTSASPADISAPKRTRVDVLKQSTIQLL